MVVEIILKKIPSILNMDTHCAFLLQPQQQQLIIITTGSHSTKSPLAVGRVPLLQYPETFLDSFIIDHCH